GDSRAKGEGEARGKRRGGAAPGAPPAQRKAMPSVPTLLALSAAALGACLGAGRPASPPPPAVTTAAADTSRADLLVEQGDDAVAIRGIFRNGGEWAGALAYRLEAAKEGP